MIQLSYGSSPSQHIRVYNANVANAPVVLVIHGGFWGSFYSIDNACIDTIQPFFSSKGFNVCMIEYRRVGEPGGGYPNTNDDIVAAIHKLYQYANENGLQYDFSRSVVWGHSAGGTLALWTCCATTVSTTTATATATTTLPSTILPFHIRVCAAFAPVGDLPLGAARRLSNNGDAVQLYANTLNDDKNNIINASPSSHLPMKSHTLIVSGEKDNIVPVDVIVPFHEQCLDAVKNNNNNNDNESFQLEYFLMNNTDHFQMVDANYPLFLEAFDKILALLDA